MRTDIRLNVGCIPTRYPNGLPDLTPGQVYRQEDANRGLEAAHILVTACRQWLEAYQQTPSESDEG